MKQLIENLISALEYHVEQTRPIHCTTVVLQVAKVALAKQEGQSNFCPQCEALARELKSAKQEQGEPVAWLITDKNINTLQINSIQKLIDRARHAHHTDICLRINGQDEMYEADWLKHMVKATAPQPKQEQGEPLSNDPLPRACNLAGVDYQTFLKIKAYMPVCTTPQQRKPLTFEQADDVALNVMGVSMLDKEQAETAHLLIRATEAAHGIKE